MRKRLLAAALVTALIAPAMAADSVRGVTDNEIVIGTYTRPVRRDGDVGRQQYQCLAHGVR